LWLRDLGWGLAACYRADGVTRAAGAIGARDAIARCQAEGLPAGTVCFLDLHDLQAPACIEYYRGWLGTMLEAEVVRPGICCASADAVLLEGAARAELAERHDALLAPAQWIVGATPDYRADIVEFPMRVMGETHGGAGLHVRHCLARTRDPSRPLGASLTDVRQLIDGALVAFGHGGFPKGIASVDMDITVHDGVTTARLRVTGSGQTGH
jgi:hypothetical protein